MTSNEEQGAYLNNLPYGYKLNEQKKIPSNWSVKKLEDVSSFKQGYQIPHSQQISKEKRGYIRYLYISDFFSDNKRLFVKDSDKYYKVYSEDICVANTGNTGGKAFRGAEGVLSNNMFKISVEQSQIENNFYWYFLNSNYYWHQLQRMFNSGGQPHVGHKNMSNIKILLPPLKEQQKIASILSTWDEAISMKESLIEKKKEQKQGLMQKLLKGHVRIPDFKNEWKEFSLGFLGKTYNGLSGKNASDFGEGKPYIPYKTIFDDSKINIDKVDYVLIGNDEKQNVAKRGDIFFTTSSETPDEVGMSSVLLDDVDEIYLNSFCFGYRLNNFDILIPEFARYLFRGNDFRRKTYSLAQGSTRFNISKNEVMKIKVLLPSIDEQKSIAKVLSDSDIEIKLIEEQVKYLKEQKKGLMQLLLSGKVRVKV
ncbi:restriction endonuclease subunit S [Oceanobacillus senegalensis]|uniref:restriction endonuclease subunit S n=1 Tax=Oceanobacillus senegalensis TaxID=1936063 RepID=UPI000A30680F|nr:restriction endonuclease subunit S [Oceanobacillus senegalensis]